MTHRVLFAQRILCYLFCRNVQFYYIIGIKNLSSSILEIHLFGYPCLCNKTSKILIIDVLLLSIVIELFSFYQILDSIVVSIPACHAGDRGSIPRRGDLLVLIGMI